MTAEDLERRAAHVERGDIVLLRTDWPRRADVATQRFWRDAPWTGRAACEWLVRRGAKAVGYDYPPDHAIRTLIFEPSTPVTRHDCTTHDVFFPAGVTVIEYLTNLDAIGAPRCRFIALPLRIEGPTARPSARSRSSSDAGYTDREVPESKGGTNVAKGTGMRKETKKPKKTKKK